MAVTVMAMTFVYKILLIPTKLVISFMNNVYSYADRQLTFRTTFIDAMPSAT